MLQIQLICVGKLKESFYLSAVKEYEKRMGTLCKLSILELNEERLPDNPSPKEIDNALLKEADAISKKLLKNSRLVPLCVEGKTLSSEALSEKISTWMVEGTSAISFVIGGSFGLHESLKQRGDFRLSMSPMTFPHHLARVMVLEQIYRAFQIQLGSPYHK